MSSRSQIVALSLFSLACWVSVREYYTFQALAKLDMPWSGIEAVDNIPEAEEKSAEEHEELENGIIHKTVMVCSGDTLFSILGEAGVSANDIDRICKKLYKTYNLRSLQINQQLMLELDRQDGKSQLLQMILEDKIGNTITLSMHKKTNEYVVDVKKRLLENKLRSVRGIVNTSFSHAARAEGVPQAIVCEASRAISPIVPILKLQKGSPFELVYDEKVDAETGKVVGGRRLRYVAVCMNGVSHKVYRFKDQGYYTEDGKSVKHESFTMPLKNRHTRISSPFGYRTHPILGIFKRHTGIDYAAGYGTEVYAAAAGKVVFAGYNGGYGLYVRIRHSNDCETAYAHLSSINVAKGSYVSQGKTIGRVGRSGRVTGAHLHYEMIRNRDYVNPLKYISVGSVQLSRNELLAFKKEQQEVMQHLPEPVSQNTSA